MSQTFSFRFQTRRENVIRSKKGVKMLKSTVIIISFVCALSAVADKASEPVVCFESGCVKGKTFEGNLKPFEAFLGIPYAKKPVNELRLRVS